MGGWIRLTQEKPREELQVHIVFTKPHKLPSLFRLSCHVIVTRLRHILVLIPAGNHAWTSDWGMFICLPDSFNLVCQLFNCCPSAAPLPSSIDSVLPGVGIYKLHSPDSTGCLFSVQFWQEKETFFPSHILLLLLVFLEIAADCQWSKLLL